MTSRHLSRLLIAFAAFSLSASLAGCGGGGGGTGDDDSGSEIPGDSSGLPVLSIADAEAVESSDTLAFTATLSEPAAEPVSFTVEPEGATAEAGIDFSAEAATLVFDPGESTRTVEVGLIDDAVAESLEAFTLTVTGIQGASMPESAAIGTIRDDDFHALDEFDSDWDAVGAFAPASVCADCHRASPRGESPAVMREPAPGGVSPSPEGEDISPYAGWRHSMMAHSFDDPYFQAVMAQESERFPELAGFIEDKCLTCHSPMARTHAHQTGEGLGPDGYYRAESALDDMHAREGVSCTVCHQIQDDGNLGTAFSGSYTIDADAESPTIYGPFQNPVSQPMEQVSGYTPAHGEHLGSSAVCATCHNLRTPTLDADTGQPTGEEFLEQGPYFEWLNSDYRDGGPRASSCQDCHMASPDEDGFTTRIAVRPNGSVNTAWPERNPFSPHDFTGGNTHVLTMLREYREELAIDTGTSVAGFDRKIEDTRRMLGTAASLDVGIGGVSGDGLDFSVTITNHTGHKLPTSYPSRRMWLEVVVRDAGGARVFASGVPDDRGRLGVDAAHVAERCLAPDKPAGFDNGGCYEPHRDRITASGQVAIYEPVMADTNGSINYVLLKADHYLKDNRIPPAGFRTDAPTFEPDTAPAGVEGDPDFNRAGGTEGSGTDTVHYALPVTGATPPFTVSVRLLYQSIRPAFAEAVHGEDWRVSRFKTLYLNVPPVVEVLAEASASVE
ncbi:hypothetical protein H0Z60_08510 [Ectothiorhodospiraceae bacterium WFHF3C12]|nr:hypothetical protein [Ectothiorhodospiraceae bacterium WFHF3C12]